MRKLRTMRTLDLLVLQRLDKTGGRAETILHIIEGITGLTEREKKYVSALEKKYKKRLDLYGQ